MDRWACEQLDPWLEIRREVPAGALFCVLRGPTRGRACAGPEIRLQLRKAHSELESSSAGNGEFERDREPERGDHQARQTRRVSLGEAPPRVTAPRSSEPLVTETSDERTYRRSLIVAQAVVVFAETQNGWPATAHVLNLWAKATNVSVKDYRRSDWAEEQAQARQALAEKGAAVPDRELLRKRSRASALARSSAS